MTTLRFGRTYLDSYAFMENLPSKDMLMYIDNTDKLTILWRANNTVLSSVYADGL